MQSYFNELADRLTGSLAAGEVLQLHLAGEDSDFLRLNHGVVRHAGTVRQAYLTLSFVAGSRQSCATLGISGRRADDDSCCLALLTELRSRLPELPEDPYLAPPAEVRSTEQVGENRLPDTAEVLEALIRAGRGRDLVAFHTQGQVFEGFANSLGQRNWFSAHSFVLDWAFYLQADKAVKTMYAGQQWSGAEFERKMATAADQLALLARPAKTIPPGPCRVYLAPAALNAFLDKVCVTGFGLRGRRTKTSSLLKMAEQGACLSPRVTLREHTCDGVAPNFQPAGFVRPPTVTLIDQGRLVGALVSPRSAREYGAICNGAAESEAPQSLEMAPGEIAEDDILRRLDTGAYVNNLWYVNFSDRPAARLTGLTRFATFWVESGRIVGPLNVMRFDDTVYRVLGESLIGLTRNREFLVSSLAFGARSAASRRLPGALVDGFAFTL